MSTHFRQHVEISSNSMIHGTAELQECLVKWWCIDRWVCTTAAAGIYQCQHSDSFHCHSTLGTDQIIISQSTVADFAITAHSHSISSLHHSRLQYLCHPASLLTVQQQLRYQLNIPHVNLAEVMLSVFGTSLTDDTEYDSMINICMTDREHNKWYRAWVAQECSRQVWNRVSSNSLDLAQDTPKLHLMF